MRKKETGRSTAEVEVQPKTRDRKSRNSWADIYNETTALRKHKKILGQDAETDDGLEWRIKWGQRGTGVSSMLTLICWLAKEYIATTVIGALTLIFLGILYYKNVSFVIAKRLLLETNVVIILVLGLCNWSIDIARPTNSFAPIYGLIYMLAVVLFLFLDAVKVKSRVFVIVIGVLFVLMNIYNIYNNVFGDSNQGIVLLEYTIQGNEYTFMKRSTKRSIFVQIVLFSMNGIYTIFKDKKTELMIFATGNIYRETVIAQEVETDENLEWRVKWGQRGAGVTALVAVICYVALQFIAAIVFMVVWAICVGMLYYKNFSFVIARRLMRETNVVIILVFGLCIWSIDIARPSHSLSSVNGFVYVLMVTGFVFIDAVKVRSPVFIIVGGILFVVGNINNIYNLTFTDLDQGVVLFKYTIQGNEYNFMKRSVKRSIFIQIMLFSMNGIYT
eukprot:g3771.t1